MLSNSKDNSIEMEDVDHSGGNGVEGNPSGGKEVSKGDVIAILPEDENEENLKPLPSSLSDIDLDALKGGNKDKGSVVEHTNYDDLKEAIRVPFLFKWVEWTKLYLTPFVLFHSLFPWKQQDIRKVHPHQDAKYISSMFIADVKRRISFKQRLPVLRAMFNQFGLQILLVFLAFALEAGSFLSTSLIQEELLKWMMDPTQSTSSGYQWVGYLILVQVVGNICRAFRTQYSLDLGVKLKMSTSNAIYEKVMTLHPKDQSKISTGQLISFLGVDSKTIQTSALFIPWTAWSIVGFIGSISLTIRNVGWVGTLCFAVILLMLPFQTFASGLFGIGIKNNLGEKDKRIKKTNEAMKGIQILKYFNWEKNSEKSILALRLKEVFWLVIQNIGFVITISTTSLLPVLFSIVIFSIYQIENELTPQLVFPTLTYLIQLNFSVAFLPMQLSFLAAFLVSLSRIDKFLSLRDRDEGNGPLDTNYPISIKNGTFRWTVYQEDDDKESKKKRKTDKAEKEKQKKIEDEQNGIEQDAPKKLSIKEKLAQKFNPEKEVQEIYIRNVNFHIKQGELALLVGPVGSGKSSVTAGLLNEIERVEGEVSLTGKVAFVNQTPWIQNMTIKDNILFGSPYDEEKFKHVLKICCLEHDLTTFRKGYETLVGENGVTVSGGQKARLALARAVYQDADVYIFDDSLSAVDPGIGQSIFSNLICNYLKGKTRLFVTHQIPFCEYADKIIIMKDLEVIEQGTYNELKDEGYLKELLDEVSSHQKHDADGEDATVKKEEIIEVIDHDADDILMSDEELARGQISIMTILRYILESGGPFIIPMVFFFIFSEIVLAAPNLWLRFFVDDEFKLSTNDYLIGYICIASASPFFIFIRDALFHTHTTVAAERIHRKVLRRIMRAPMAFFHTTPLGRIMSRFSTDQLSLDQNLVQSLKFLCSSFIGLFVAFAMGIYASYWYSIAVVLSLASFGLIGEVYRRNAREVKRIENTARSPLFSQFSESVNGAGTIRAYGKEKDFIDSFFTKSNYLSRVELLDSCLQGWAVIHLDFLSLFLVTSAFLLAIWTKGSSSASAIGLAITYTTSLPFLLQGILEHAANTEREFNSVERMLYYARKIPVEPSGKGCKQPPKNWPGDGTVEFQDYSMRYRPGLPLVLKNVNFKIQSGERVGIVGRSGSGKSSLIQSLFRIVEAQQGRILIDGEDISEFSLEQVRKSMTIIPQNPTIFSGSIRSNLDPFKQFTDEQVIDALKQAHLWDYVDSLDAKLNSSVDEDGSNMSAGQRQLCCLARALLNDAQILLLDEVTSSVDSQSDSRIQKVVSKMRRNGKKLTTIAIAHRLNTIITYDKILVMKDGSVGEFGSPKELVTNSNSLFYGMIMDMGPHAARKLISIALDDEKPSEEEIVHLLDDLSDESKVTNEEEQKEILREVLEDKEAKEAEVKETTEKEVKEVKEEEELKRPRK